MKNKLLLIWLLVLTCLAVHSQRWAEKGEFIYGIEENDIFGSAISLSSDGKILAVGANEKYGLNPGKGYVLVYEWDGSEWVQRGSKLNGSDIEDAFGSSVSLSSDGNLLAIGAKYGDTSGYVRVFRWNGSNWSKKGGDIIGLASNEKFGKTVKLSPNGNRLAIGAPGFINQGHVRVYEWNGSSWEQMGNDISGEDNDNEFGASISWNFAGSILAIGAPYHSDTSYAKGQVRTYTWDGVNWIQRGQVINGAEQGYTLGNSLSLDSIGNTVVIGGSRASVGNFETGLVKVYKWDDSVWVPKGNKLLGDRADNLGSTVHINSHGNKMFVGTEAKRVEIYSFNDTIWVKEPTDISDEYNTYCFDVTPDGKTVAIGDQTVSSNTGIARVYRSCYDTYHTISVNTCTSYTSPSGKILETSGEYMDTILNKACCDSIITINLTINNTTDTAFSVGTCKSYTSPSGKVWVEDSLFIDTIPNTAGCDSIMTIDLTIFETAFDTSTLTECVSYTSPSGKYIWTESGTYTDTMETAKGCDSIITTHLTINKVDISVLTNETTLTANANFAAYQWLNCNNNYSKIDGATYQSFTPSTKGWYAVEITLQNGCVDTSGCFGIGTSDIQVNDFGNDFNVYPNPTSGNISIELGKMYHEVILSLKTLDGRNINTMEAGTCNRVEYTIQSPPGTYLLEIKADENMKATIKIIKH